MEDANRKKTEEINQEKLSLKPSREVLMPLFEEIVRNNQNQSPVSGSVSGLPTGFIDIDRVTSGFQPGELIVVGARPGMGKTVFALNVAEHVALRAELPVAIFSIEMKASQVIARLLCSNQRIKMHQLKSGSLSGAELQRLSTAITDISNSNNLFIDDSAYLTLSMLRERCKLLKQKIGVLGLVIVDYIQLMSSEMALENRYLEMAALSRGLKLLAKELDCPIIAVSQLNRFVEQRPDKRPILSDLRDSGTLEDDADVVILLYRDVVYNLELKGTDQERDAEALIRKQRNGVTASIELTFFGEYSQFKSRSIS